MSYETDEFWREFRPLRQTVFGLICTWVFSHEMLDWLQPGSDITYVLAGLSMGMAVFGSVHAMASPRFSLERADGFWCCLHWVAVLSVLVLFG